MTRKSVREQEISDLRMRADHRVLVERIVIVMPGPGALELERFHGRYAVRQRRPDHVLEQRVLHIEIGRARVRFGGRRDAADIDLAPRTYPYTPRVHHPRQSG